MTQKSSDRLPVTALVLLAVAGFVTILTEALPAGLLPQISASFGVSQALAGQWISVYALGSLLAAIPLTTATRHWNRRRVLLWAISGFAIGNLVTAMTGSFVVALCGRLVGGMAAGLLWALLAGYAVRMAPARLAGRAMAIAMSGTPVALSIGIPLGTFLGDLMGWRTAFAGLSVIAALLAGGIIALVPDFAGEAGAARLSLGQVLRLPGVRPVLMVTLLYVLAHNVLYTYIAALLAAGGIIGRTDQALLVFGMTALVGIGLVGLAIDRWLRTLTFVSIGLFLASTAILLGAPNGGVVVVFGAMAAWGLAFGGAATLFQTASARAAGPAADVAQSMIVTAWNLAIAGGAVLGGTILDHAGAAFLPLAAAMLLVGALVASVRIKATS